MANIRTRSIVGVSSEVTGIVRSIKSILNDIDPTLIRDNGVTCVWWGVQNKNNAGVSLYNESSASAGANDNVEVTAGAYRQFPPCGVKYDLNQEFIRVGVDNQVFSLDIMWG